MANQPNMLKAGWRSLEGGVDYGLPAHLIDPNQVSLAINTSFRGGNPHPRPAVARRVLSFANPDDATPFKTGLFQGMGYYDPTSGPQVLIVSISGRHYRISPLEGYKVSNISITTDGVHFDYNSSIHDRVWMVQADSYMISQNGVNAPWIFDGSSARRPNISKREVPTGKAMGYAFKRLWVSRGLEYWAGDILGGPTGVLQFTENDFLNEGGSFAVDSPHYEITAMAGIANLNTALGTSDLAIYTPMGMWLNSVPQDRASWKNLTNPIQRVGLLDNGAVSDRSLVSVNSDQWFRSPDGLRSGIVAVRYFQQWGNLPQSGELSPILNLDSPDLISYGSGVLFQNRLIETVSPSTCANGVYHRGLVVLDFDLVSRMRKQIPPAWEGVWVAGRILQIITGRFGNVNRCFFLASNCDNQIELWELGTDDKHFDNWDSTPTPISWGLDFKSYDMGDARLFKKLESADFYISNLEGRSYFTAIYRSGRNPCLNAWHTWSEASKMQDCTPTSCANMTPYQPQGRGPMRLPQPPDVCDPTNQRLTRTAYEFQPALRISGYCELSMMELKASPAGEETLPFSPCLTQAQQQELRCCPSNPFDDGVFPFVCAPSQGGGGGGGGGGGDGGGGGPPVPPITSPVPAMVNTGDPVGPIWSKLPSPDKGEPPYVYPPIDVFCSNYAWPCTISDDGFHVITDPSFEPFSFDLLVAEFNLFNAGAGGAYKPIIWTDSTGTPRYNHYWDHVVLPEQALWQYGIIKQASGSLDPTILLMPVLVLDFARPCLYYGLATDYPT